MIEDVDLVAESRSRRNSNQFLFDLLQEMDGVSEDTDLLFILTTNAPHVLEPALAQRPGRIDQAIEIPLPNAECRRRLIELHSRALPIQLKDIESLVDITANTSAAFTRELFRRAALLALEEGVDTIVTDRHLHASFDALTSSKLLQRSFGLLVAEPTSEGTATMAASSIKHDARTAILTDE